MPRKPEYFHALSAKIDVLTVQVANLRTESDELLERVEHFKESIAEIQRDVAVGKQQTETLIKRIEEWDRRWWTLIVVLIGALISLASGLIVTLVKR